MWVGMGAGDDGLCVSGRGPECRGGCMQVATNLW